MMKSILILTNSSALLNDFHGTITPEYTLTPVPTFAHCREILSRTRYDVLLLDISLLSFPGMPPKSDPFEESYKLIREIYPTLPIIVFGDRENALTLVDAVKKGASRYLFTPLEPHATKLAIYKIQESQRLKSELSLLRKYSWDDDKQGVVKTNSPVMAKLFNDASSAAKTDSTIMLLGETGVGKGVLAKLIHRNSNRKTGPFVHVHCGAIPDNLIESELFGHEKGAFTGAVQRKQGRFEIAKGGTIFLDEIGTISAAAQTKLLQVLQDKVLMRVGGESMISTDTRIIAATNSDLLEMSKQGEFREDLYYRVHVFPLSVPPLRERLEDLPYLANNFFKHLEGEYQKKLKRIDPEVMSKLQQYHFPGNIRELENILERAYVLEKSDSLTVDSLPADILHPDQIFGASSVDISLPIGLARQHTVDLFEEQYLSQLLAANAGKIAQTATSAGISDRQLRKLMRKYNLFKESFKK